MQMLLILLSIVENKGRVDKLDFARRMREWMMKGFPELGDVGQFDSEQKCTMNMIVCTSSL